jgi:flagellar hook-length control protein FliK
MATSAPGSMPGPNQLPGLPLQRLRAEVKQAPPVAPATAPSGQVGPPAATLPPLPAGLLSDVVTRALLQRTEQPSLSPPAPLTATSGSLPESLQTPLQVALPPGSAPKVEQAFNEGMAVRLQWMTQQQMGRAEIQLHPAELGSIDVQIEFEGKAVRAEFLSASGEVRQLLEAGLPRLRELLEAQGLQLQHADVGSGGGRETGRDSAQAEPGSFRDAASENAAPTDGPARPAPRRHDGNLSEYA